MVIGTLRLVCLIVTGILVAMCQERTAPLEFEAVSVKPSPALGIHGSAVTTMGGGVGSDDPGRIRYTYMVLPNVISQAFGVSHWQISGPRWLDEARFDITATMPPDTTKDQFRTMLRQMLVMQFKLAWHIEKMEVTGFSLRRASGGVRLEAVDDAENRVPESVELIEGSLGRKLDRDGFSWAPFHPGLNVAFARRRSRVRSIGATMDQFATLLGNQLEKPVANETELHGKYNFTLTYEMKDIGGVPPPPGYPEAEYAPGLVEALSKQLGLRLERKKAAVDRIVIDSIERTPQDK